MVSTKDTWPHNYPDLNPMDYYVWGVVQAKVSDHSLVGLVAAGKVSNVFFSDLAAPLYRSLA